MRSSDLPSICVLKRVLRKDSAGHPSPHRNFGILIVLVIGAFAFRVDAAQAQSELPHISPLTEANRPARLERNRLDGLYREAIERRDDEGALDLAVRSLAAAEAGFNPDEEPILESVNQLATAYERLGRFAEAEPLRIRVLRAHERILGAEHERTLFSIDDLAGFYSRRGRYAEAEPLFIRAVDISERTRGRDDLHTIAAIESLATLYLGEGRFAEAEALFNRLLQWAERRYGADHAYTLSGITNLAAVYAGQRRYAEAEPLMIRALDGFERTRGPDHSSTLLAAANLAGLYNNQQRYADAEPLYLRVSDARERVGGRDDPETLMAYQDLATVYTHQGRHDDAEYFYTHAFETWARVRGRDDPATIYAAWDLAWSRLFAGDGLAALIPARVAMRGLRSRRQKIGTGAFDDAQRDREASQESNFISLLADADWAHFAAGGDRDFLAGEAFSALQEATAGTTNRAVIQMAIRRFAARQGAGLAALMRERDDLNDQWAAINARYVAALAGPDTDDPAGSTSAGERTRIEQRMGAIDDGLRRDFPQYFALLRPEPVDLATTQAMLAPDEAILMVVPTRFGTHMMVIRQNGPLHWVRSDWTRTEVDQAVGQLLADIRRTMNGGRYAFDRQVSFDLYNHVVAPVAGQLAGMRHVSVVAAGSLSTIPFGILVTRNPQGANDDPRALRDTSWFADAYALTAIPSIQSLRFLRQYGGGTASPATRGSGFIGFGNPSLEGPVGQPQRCARGGAPDSAGIAAVASGRQTRTGGMLADVGLIRTLCPLPGTATELENMRTAFGAPTASVFSGARSTESSIRTMDLSGARILALATHGLVAGEISRSAEPGLVFTPPATATEADDGYLTASEVSALNLNADWVILSACNTAAGDGSTGAPGLSGLARAFFYAGARNLLASHWPVADDAGARLTVRTIQLMQEHPGISRAEGLQRSMREIRENTDHPEWAHPGVWAPFSLIGDGAH
jgi:CHAT domain-containing protein/tetratricopeptide (TPR) repeat protein